MSKIKQKMEMSSQFTPMELAKIEQRSSIDANFSNFFEEGGSDNFYNKSLKLTEAMRLKKDMSLVSKAKNMEKYGNYQDFSEFNFERKEKSFSKFKEEEMIESRNYTQDFKTGSLVKNVNDYDLDHNDMEQIDIQQFIQDSNYLTYSSRRELFKLHREGWSNRRLSVRFGIIPERVKAIIYCEKLKMC